MIQKFWIVWNGNKDFCNFPTREHYSLTDANQEAERLAAIHKGKKFSVLQLVGTVRTTDIQWEFPEDDPPF